MFIVNMWIYIWIKGRNISIIIWKEMIIEMICWTLWIYITEEAFLRAMEGHITGNQ